MPYAPASRLAGKTCVVFGGTGHVGAGACLAFANEGAKVYATSRSQENLDATRTLYAWPESVIGIVAGFNSDEEAAASVESVWKAAGGSVDHVVNSVGFSGMNAPFTETTTEDLLKIIGSDVLPRLRASRFAAQRMLTAEGATLMTVSGGMQDGIHNFSKQFPAGGLWAGSAMGGAMFTQATYAIASEVIDKKGALRAATVSVHMMISRLGEEAQQLGVPAESDSSVTFGRVFVATALDRDPEEAKLYRVGPLGGEDVEALLTRILG